MSFWGGVGRSCNIATGCVAPPGGGMAEPAQRRNDGSGPGVFPRVQEGIVPSSFGRIWLALLLSSFQREISSIFFPLSRKLARGWAPACVSVLYNTCKETCDR